MVRLVLIKVVHHNTDKQLKTEVHSEEDIDVQVKCHILARREGKEGGREGEKWGRERGREERRGRGGDYYIAKFC